MPLTNAEKQKAHRQRQREKMARYEGALREIVILGEITSPTHSEFNQGAEKAWGIASAVAAKALS